MRISVLYGPSPLFFDHKIVRRITKSPFLLTHQSRVFPTVHPHHLPLELWYMLWGEHGDVLSWPPFKDFLSNCCKCYQWATLNHQPLWGQPMCNGPSRERYKVLASGCVRKPWRAIITPDPHGVSSGHLASDADWSFPLPYPISSLLISQCWPQGHPWYTSQH